MSESSDIDVPNLPFKKPVEIEELEELTFEQREAMDFQEMEERISGIAYVLAEAYKNKFRSKADEEECISIIHAALAELGTSLSGKFGTKMISLSSNAAKEASKEVFEEE